MGRLRRRDLSTIGLDPATWWQVGDGRGKGGTEAWLWLRHGSTPVLGNSPPLLHLYSNLLPWKRKKKKEEETTLS